MSDKRRHKWKKTKIHGERCTRCSVDRNEYWNAMQLIFSGAPDGIIMDYSHGDGIYIPVRVWMDCNEVIIFRVLNS